MLFKNYIFEYFDLINKMYRTWQLFLLQSRGEKEISSDPTY